MVINNELTFDVVIIGAGPAGLTCSIYASRGNLKVAFIDKGAPGGKMTATYEIENWSGEENIKGYELSTKMLNHALKLGAKHIYGNVIRIENISEFEHYVYLENNQKIKAKAIVIASGMDNKKPPIPNIDFYNNKGVSYCVICDAPFYKNKPAAIIGGGDSAFEESIYLSSIASKVYIFIRKSYPKAEPKMVEDVQKIDNIEIIYNSEIIELFGKEQLEKVKYIENGEEKFKEINHLYPYIGFLPINYFAKDLPIFDANGFIETNENMETKVQGIYAIGDVRQKSIRQIVTAASDGAIAGKILTNKIKK